METREFRLLKELYKEGVGGEVMIVPILKTIFSDYAEEKPWGGGTKRNYIARFVAALFVSGLITSPIGDLTVTQHKDENNYSYDEVNWNSTYYTSITYRGKKAVEREFDKEEKKKLMASALLTEQSVRDTNDLTTTNIREQEKAQKATIRIAKSSVTVAWISTSIAALSLFTTSATVVQSCNDHKADSVIAQMKAQKVAFDSINSNLERLYKSSSNSKRDTTGNYK